MTYSLRRADPGVKWLVTCLLATFGLAYVFGGWMVGLYSGFTPDAVAVTFVSPPWAMTMPPATTVIEQRPIQLHQVAAADAYTVDRNLLIQDTHVHVPMYGVIAGVLSRVALGLEITAGARYALITLLFTAPWLDFAGMWLTKYASPQLAVLTVPGGFAMGVAYTVVAAVALWQMWRPDHKRRLAQPVTQRPLTLPDIPHYSTR